MRKFMINVNGKTYEVEVEEVYNDIPSRPSAAIASVTSESAAASAVSQSQSAAAAQMQVCPGLMFLLSLILRPNPGMRALWVHLRYLPLCRAIFSI